MTAWRDGDGDGRRAAAVWRGGDGCAVCAAPLASDQRYCLACGARRAGAEPPALIELAWALDGGLPAERPAALLGAPGLPAPRSAAALTAVVLGMGVLIGAAVGPAAVGSPEAAQRQVILVSAPGGVGSGASGATAPALDPPSGDVGADGGAGDAGAAAGGADAGSGDGGSGSSGNEGGGAGGTGGSSGGDGGTSSGDGGGTGGRDTGSAGDTTTPTGRKLTGTIVHVNDGAQSFTVADAHGRLWPVHASPPLPPAGEAVVAHVRKLANGTYATDDPTAGKAAGTAKLSGVVTAVDATRGAYVLSVRGASLVIDVPGAAEQAPTTPSTPTPGATTTTTIPAPAAPATTTPPATTTAANPAATTATNPAATTATNPAATTATDPAATTPAHDTATTTTPAPPQSPLPAIGRAVTTDVTIVAAVAAKGGKDAVPARLLQRTRKDGAAVAKALDLAGIVETVDARQRLVTVTADDLGTLAGTVTVRVPAPFKLDALIPDVAVAVTGTFQADGSFALTGVSSDAGTIGADNRDYVQGDQTAKR